MFRYRDRQVIDDIAELRRNVETHALELRSSADLDPLMERIGDSRVVMLGEANRDRLRPQERARPAAALWSGVDGARWRCNASNDLLRTGTVAGDPVVMSLKTWRRIPRSTR